MPGKDVLFSGVFVLHLEFVSWNSLLKKPFLN
jgi:hypothetical protein